MAQQNEVRGVHTAIRTNDKGNTQIIYRGTTVVEFNSDMIILNSNGYRTATTKTRMMQASNQFDLGYKVYQRKGNWYVDFKGETITYTDAMILER